MKMQYFFILCFSFSQFIGNVCSSLPASTKILSDSASILIEELTLGVTVTSFDVADISHPSVVVQEVIEFQSQISVEIKTQKGSIYVAPQQEFYELTQGVFVAAGDLKKHNILVSRNHGNIECRDVALHCLSTPTNFYKLSLSGPDLFFSTDLELLTHNFAPTASLIPALIKEFAGVAIIAYVSLQGKTEFFANLELGKNQAFKNIAMFTEPYTRQLPSNNPLGVSYVANPPLIAGIKPDQKMYHHMRQYPQLYSPMIVTAEMNRDGDVVCTLLTMHLNSFDGKTNWYAKQVVGREAFSRQHSFIKIFVQEEDKKQSLELRKFITTWPPAMYAQLFKSTLGIAHEIKIFKPYGCFDRTIHGVVFGMHAIRRMVEKKIAPSQVLHVVAHGKCIGARHPERIIFYDQPLDLAVVIEKISKKILNVGTYSTDIKNLNEATPEQEEAEKRQKEEAEKKEKERKEAEEKESGDSDSDIDQIDDNKIKHILQGKHNWDKFGLGGDLNNNDPGRWEKIKTIVRDVLKKGLEEPYGSAFKKSKIVNGNIVEVSYIVINGIKRVSNAWVR